MPALGRPLRGRPGAADGERLTISAPAGSGAGERTARLRRVPDDGSVIADFQLRPGEAESGFPLRMLLDTVLLECFAAGGRGVASAIGPQVAPSNASLWVEANETGVRLANASVYQMQHI